MRKLAAALLATALVAAPTAVGAAGTGEEEKPFSTFGRMTGYFREPHAGLGEGQSCYQDGDHRTCLPSGASQNILPDGRVLYWNAIEGSEDLAGPVGTEGHRRAGDSRSRLLTLGATPSWAVPGNESGYFAEDRDPEDSFVPQLKVEERGDTPNDGSLFCADNTFLPNGDVLTVGGTDYYAEPGVKLEGQPSIGVLELEGLKAARSFTAKGSTWKREGSMTYGRWYPSLTTLADGTVLASSGVTKLLKPAYAPNDPNEQYRPQDNGRNVVQSEVFDPRTSTWSVNPESANRSLPLYPRMHLLPNGHVYYDAAGQAYNPAGQGYDEALWNVAASYDPVAKTWTDLGIPGLTTGVTEDPGFRGSTFSQMLPLKAPYDRASFLSAGGVVGTSPGSYVPVKSARINQWSTTEDPLTKKATQTLTTHPAGALAERRWYGSGVTLPDGSVIVLSGGDLDHVIAPGTETPITRIERFVPNEDGTGGEWTTLANAQRGRTYHNAATLLPDGRVLIGGHDPIPTLYGPQNDDLSTSNHEPDATFEIFSPPYLYDGNAEKPRPVIEADPEVRLGKQLTLGTSGANKIDKVVLVRNPSVTHLIDADQRNVELEFTQSGSSVRASVPDNPAVLPPGPYLLFAINTSGTPSVAEQVVVGDPSSSKVTTPPSSSSKVTKDAPNETASRASTGDSSDGPKRRQGGSAGRTTAAAAGRPSSGEPAVSTLAATPASSERPSPLRLPVVALIAAGALSFVAFRTRRSVVAAAIAPRRRR